MLWGYFWSNLGPRACHVPTDEQTTRSVDERVVDMFHGDTATSDQERIVEAFSTDGPLRCVAATSAFEMGVQVSDVRYVVHWGPAGDLLDYWQQVGRAGRDGRPSEAICYLYPTSVNVKFIKPEMVKFTKSNDRCLRKSVLKQLIIPGMDESVLHHQSDSCCSSCDIEPEVQDTYL